MLRFKNLTLDSPLLLAPMAEFTNLPFRVALRELGGLALTVTELVNARALLELHPKALRLAAAAAGDRPFGVQLFGANLGELRDAARLLADLGVDLIDLNLGCPAPKVNAGGGGAALWRDEALLVKIAAAVAAAVPLPVTVKTRLGWDTVRLPRLAPALEQAGVAAIAVHGRTRAQGYGGAVNLAAIAATVSAVQIPVIGNGDVRSHADAARLLGATGCAGVMIGRAALGNPFIFRDTRCYLQTGAAPPPLTADAVLRFMHRHFALTVDFFGEATGCRLFRKFIPGYSARLPHRRRWRVETQRLATVGEYWELVARLGGD